MTNDSAIKKIPTGKTRAKAGLDIGSYSIKMVEMFEGPDKPTLLNFGMERIRDVSKDGMAAQIKLLVEKQRVSTKNIAVSVSGPSVIVRFISMPRMSHEELAGAIRFEAEKFIPFNIADCVTDFQILRKLEQENRLEILLVAAKKDLIEDRIRIVEAAGLSARVVDVESFALANAFSRNVPTEDPDKTIALLNIGATISNLSILRGNVLCFVRDMAIGGNDFDAAISKSLAVSVEAAEEMKKVPVKVPKEKGREMTSSTRPAVNSLLDEIRPSFSYYENQYGRTIDDIYLSGGAAAMAGLDGYFEEAFGIKPLRWNPFQFLTTDSAGVDTGLLENTASSFAIAVGLALR